MGLPKIIAMIACTDSRGGIGKDGKLLFDFPKDLQNFKAMTEGRTVVMGRKTWESLPKKPLPNRYNIVLSRTMPEPKDDNCEVVRSRVELLDAISGLDEVWVIGGAEVYRAMFPYATHFVMTVVDAEKDADTFFPNFDNVCPTTPYKFKAEIDGKEQSYCSMIVRRDSRRCERVYMELE